MSNQLMTENKLRATREALSQVLLDYSAEESLIVLSADLKKPTKVDKFAEKFPNKYIECGIAEANMIGISAGLAQGGFQPICSSFASFLTGRYDIIRVSIAYQNAPVVLVGTHAGLAIGKDGVTQMGLEDISLMRGLPNMVVLNPSTYNQAIVIIKKLITKNRTNPFYLRLGRQPVSEHYFENEVNDEIGFSTIGEGEDVAICTTGCVLDEALKAKKVLEGKGIYPKIIDVFKIQKNIGNELANCLRKYKNIICVEDHMSIGGLGTYISEGILDHNIPSKIRKIGVQNIFPQSGAPNLLYSRYGIDSKNIIETSLELLNN